MQTIPGLNELPIVLYPNRWKQIALLLLCTMVAAAGAFAVRGGARIGFLFVLFPGLSGLVIGLSLRRQASYLKLESDSFTVCNLFRTHTTLWTSVEHFGVLVSERRAFQVRRRVMWNYTHTFANEGRLRSLARSMTGYDAGLTDLYSCKAQMLADSMQRLRDEAVKRKAAASQNSLSL